MPPEGALCAVVQEAYDVHGVSTRKVDELVKALGRVPSPRAGFHSSARSWTRRSSACATGLLEGPYPYLFWVDATYLKARQDGRVGALGRGGDITVGVVRAQTTGERELLAA